MPRKQRFKPSRKPKPVAQNEEPMIERAPSSAQAQNDSIGSRTSASSNDNRSAGEPDPTQQSR